MAVDWVRATAEGVTVLRTAPVTPPVQSLDPACPPGKVPPSGFTDVAPGSVLARAIDCVAWWTITTGTGPATYEPTGAVTRAQMATFIARLIRASQTPRPPGEAGQFPDVPDDSPHRDSIDALASAGIVAGRPDGTYDPGAPVTRDQMATFLSRAYEMASGEALTASRDWFPDDGGSVHEAAINEVTSAGLAGGRTDGTYGPRRSVERAQMASFLARTLSLLVEGGHADLPSSG
jgi:hypothetical protein